MPEKCQVQERRDEVFAKILNFPEGKLSSLLSPFRHEAARLECCRPIAVFVEAVITRSVADLFAMISTTYFAPQAQMLRRI